MAIFNLSSFSSYASEQISGGSTPEGMIRIDVGNLSLFLSEVMRRMARYQSEMPGHEVFMDGDLYAIVARRRDAA